jgi:ABC-type branched-subunit amino acid transport system ATPase component/branched-subunit amino acid ABC-type transport system permease component
VIADVVQFALLGLATGAVFALIGHSVVAVNVGSGVLDFSAGAFGMIGALTFYGHRGQGQFGALGGLVLALGIAAMMGAAAHLLIMRPLANAPAASRIFASLGLMTTLFAGVALFTKNKGAPQYVESPLPGGELSLGFGISIGWDRVTATAIAIGATILLIIARRHTRLGLASSAVAENRFIAATMGWSPNLIGAVTWAVGSMVATTGAILFAAFASLSPENLTFLVIPSLAAALIGRFQSFGWTLAGALAIGITQSELTRFVRTPGWPTATPLLVIIGVLALRGTSLPARTENAEQRPNVGTGRLRWTTTLLVPVLVLIGALHLTTAWTAAFTVTFTYALIILSVIVLTGYAGQLSLAQVTMAGVGAYFTALIAVETGMPLLLAMICGVAAITPLAILVALPALRTRGHVLAVSTFGLAAAIDALVLNNPSTAVYTEGKPLGSLSLFGFDLSGLNSPTAFAITCLVVFTIVAVGVANLRRGRVGRRLLAVRSNEVAATSLGISVVSSKLYAFWLAATIAALGGAMLEARFGIGDVSSFPLIDNINILLFAVIGGLGWIATAVAAGLAMPGGLSQELVLRITSHPGGWFLFIGAILAVLNVIQAPNGLVPIYVAIGRWTARRTVHLKAMVQRLPLLVRARPVRAKDVSMPVRARAITRVRESSLEIDRVTVRFGTQAALRDAGLTLNTGEIVGLIGANGAGKSTMIDVATGFRAPNEGSVLLDGRPIDRLSPVRRARAGVVRTFQGLELFDDMTVLENLRVATDKTSSYHYFSDLVWPRRGPLTDATQVAIQELRLQPVLHRLPSELDYGKRRLVAIARALSMAPSLLLLDEPAAGLDRRERRELANLIGRLAREWGIGVLLVEHDVQMVFDVCERVIVLDFGHVIADGSVGEVRSSDAVRIAYLGEIAGESPVSTSPLIASER